jgi:hypothetical protein
MLLATKKPLIKEVFGRVNTVPPTAVSKRKYLTGDGVGRMDTREKVAGRQRLSVARVTMQQYYRRAVFWP